MTLVITLAGKHYLMLEWKLQEVSGRQEFVHSLEGQGGSKDFSLAGTTCRPNGEDQIQVEVQDIEWADIKPTRKVVVGTRDGEGRAVNEGKKRQPILITRSPPVNARNTIFTM